MWTRMMKGKFPDICSWLNDVNLTSTSGIIMMNITIKGKNNFGMFQVEK